MSVKMCRNAVFTSVIVCFLLGVVATTASAQTMFSGSKKKSFGIEYRTVNTHFAEYTSGLGTLNSWENFKLFGLSGQMMWKMADKNGFSIYAGGGASLYMGTYNYEVGMYTGSGSSGPGLDIRIFGEIDYPVDSSTTLMGQVGVSLLYLMSSGVDDDTGIYDAYEEGFGEGIPFIYLGLGGSKQLAGGKAISLMIRLPVIDLGAWTDYWIVNKVPWNEGAGGLAVVFGYHFGG